MVHTKLSPKRSTFYLLAAAVTAALFLVSACTPPAATDEKTAQEIKGLKAELDQLQKKMTKMEAEQQEVIKMLKRLGIATAPPPPAEMAAPPAAPAAPPPAQPGEEVLTVGQLLKNRDRFVNTRVTVKGMGGTVVMHHKLLMLKSPEGMVEVYFGNLQDKKVVDRLAAQEFNQPLTVSGLLTQSPKGPGLRITADKVEF